MNRNALQVVTDADTTEPTYKFRVQFSTPTVKPQTLPDFPYISVALHFDCVIYAAVVTANGMTEAISFVKRYWPEAVARETQEGVNSLPDVPQMKAVQFGAYRVEAPGWLKRLLSFLIL